MALRDRIADLTRTTNRIEAVSPIGPAPKPAVAPAATAGDLHIASPPPPADAPPAARKAAADAKAPAYATEPEAIARAYFVEERKGERRYYDDYQRKQLAITADDARIASKREDLNTIRAMLTMAESRGWSEVKVAGTVEFRREAWIEARTRGIAAQGHKPSDLDRQEADRRRAERGLPPALPPGQNEVSKVVAAPAPAQVPTPVPVPAAPALAAHAPAAQAPVAPAPAVAPAVPVQAKAGPAVQPEQARTPPVPASPAPIGQQQPAQQSARAQQPEAASAPAPDHRKVLRDATAELSPDGRLYLSALSSKIDKEMNRLNAASKLEMKAFAAAELVKKERAEGPVVLSPELKQKAAAPAPAKQPEPVRLVQPEPPKRSRAR